MRLAQHQRHRQALRRQHDISGVGKHCDDNDAQPGVGMHCDDNDAQPGASAAATIPANTTMHNPTAFHTAGVTTTCATLARLSTRNT